MKRLSSTIETGENKMQQTYTSPLQRRKLKVNSSSKKKSDFENWLNENDDYAQESPWRPVSSSSRNNNIAKPAINTKNFSGVIKYKHGKPVKKIGGRVRS